MSELQAGIAYWLSVLVVAVRGFPDFIGSNWGGFALSLAVWIASERHRLQRHIGVLVRFYRKEAYGLGLRYGVRRLMARNLKTPAVIIGAFFVGDILTVAYRDYASVSKKFSDAQGKLSESDRLCESRTRDVERQRDAQTAKNETLEKQNMDQQGTINGCLAQALKLVEQQQPALRLSGYSLKLPESTAGMGNRSTFILATNKTVSPVRLLVSCQKNITVATGGILGNNVRVSSGWGGRVTNRGNEFGIGIMEPWTPPAPILAFVYSSEADIGRCTFEQQ